VTGGSRAPLLLAAGAGLLWALCWLPTGLAIVFPVFFFCVARALRSAESGRDAVLIGLVQGLVRHAAAGHFMLALLRFSGFGIAFYLLMVAYILPFAVLETWGAFVLERRTGLPRGLLFCVLYVVLEKARTMTDVAFSADLVAHGFGLTPAALAWSPWIGPFGVALTFGLVGILLEQAFAPGRARRAALGLAAWAVALWIAPFATDLARPAPATATGPALRVALVQPTVTLDDKVDPAHWPAVWERMRSLTLAAAPGADLVLWPETARPGFAQLRNGQIVDEEMSALAKEARVPILYGTNIAEVEESGAPDGGAAGAAGGGSASVVALYNGAALANPDGRVADWYGKQKLVPFAEGIPFGKALGWDPRRRAREGARTSYLGMLGNFSAGPRATVFEVGAARIGVLICYEGHFPQLGRAYSLAGANALAVLTNDYWWGRTVFAAWHAQMMGARARELGLPVVRATNSGISSLTGADGRMLARTANFEVRTLTVPLRVASGGPTFYAVHGDWVVGLLLAALAAAVLRGVLVRPASRVPSPKLAR
jgi:apolipoprotein N-acyltransferase